MTAGAASQPVLTAGLSEAWRVFCPGITGGLLGFALSFHGVLATLDDGREKRGAALRRCLCVQP